MDDEVRIVVYLILRLPYCRKICDLMLVNTIYAFIQNLDPQTRILYKHMTAETRVVARILRAPYNNFFLDRIVIYGNLVRNVNTRTKGLAYREPM